MHTDRTEWSGTSAAGVHFTELVDPGMRSIQNSQKLPSTGSTRANIRGALELVPYSETIFRSIVVFRFEFAGGHLISPSLPLRTAEEEENSGFYSA